MKITIGNFTLADHGPLTPSGLKINGQRVAQVVEFPRAEEVEVFNRGNASNTYSFSVTRKHATPADAEAYILEHETDCPVQDLVTFEIKKANGQVTLRYVRNGMLQTLERGYHGCSTFHSYQIIGGQMLVKKPTT